MAFSITASMPLGTYKGHGADGRIESIPSVARLYSALLCAAGFGPRAQAINTRLAPSEDDEAALRWLEENPPDHVNVPAFHVNRSPAVAYRDDGTLTGSKRALSTKRLAKSPSATVAIAGSFCWTWSVPPPAGVMRSLSELCRDVPYLGTTESPVRLTTTVDDVQQTHQLDPEADFFAVGGLDVALPMPGRLAELTKQNAASAGAAPTVARDRIGTDEKSSSPVPLRERVAVARYVPIDRTQNEVPWSQAIVLPMNATVPEHRRVGWAVAAHRALIASLGEGAPSLLTGIYGAGQHRPTNRLALHVLDKGAPTESTQGAPSALVVLIPRSAASSDVDAVLTALSKIRSIRGPGGKMLRLVGEAAGVAGSQFWSEPASGMYRLWQTSPPAIPDTRGAGSHWQFSHAALLSLGYVWHGSSVLPAQSGSRSVLQHNLVNAVLDAGAVVVDASPLRTTRVHDYVHRVNEHAVVRPYRATMCVGALGGPQTVQAIGQSRHLGGGLLVPYDIPADAMTNDTSPRAGTSMRIQS